MVRYSNLQNRQPPYFNVPLAHMELLRSDQQASTLVQKGCNIKWFKHTTSFDLIATYEQFLSQRKASSGMEHAFLANSEYFNREFHFSSHNIFFSKH